MNVSNPPGRSAARRRLFGALLAAALLSTAGLCQAADAKAAKRPALVDINNASVTELQTLPGVTDAAAGRIVAGRPYGSKSQLVTRNIVDVATFDGIKARIVARQPFKDARKNAAALAKKP
jgi:DNA uptake protein ComE-like DNA-binding protein